MLWTSARVADVSLQRGKIGNVTTVKSCVGTELETNDQTKNEVVTDAC